MLQLDSSTVAGKTAKLVAAFAGAKVSVTEKSGAAVPSIATPSDGTLEGLATVCKYVASLAAPEKALAGSTPEQEAQIAEWLSRRNTELDALNTHLLTRSFLVGHGVTIADLVVYAAVQGAVAALSAEKKAAACNLVRWCDFMQAACGGKAVFGEVAVAHAEFPVFVAADPAPAAKDAKSGAGSAPKGGEGKGKGGDAKSEASGAEKGGKDKKKGGGGEQAAESKGKGKEGGAAAAAAAEGGKDKKAEKAEKKEKKPKELPVKKEIDVSVLDIRVGTILKCWEHPGADKLWVEEIDLGEGKPRQVCSGLRDFVPKERMEGARVVVLCNVKPGNMRDERSEAMVMCASNDDHTKVDFVVPPEGVPNGEKVTFEGFDGEPEAVLNPKKKQFDACQPKLMTNDKGVACYDNVPFMTTKGPCTSPLATSHIK